MESELLPETVLAGKYRICRVLGRGGMGVTYAAHSADGVAVALKVLHFHHADCWKTIELFEREARVLAQLNHPGIPSYLDSFKTDTPQGPAYCLVQGLAPGESLAALVERHWQFAEHEVKRIGAELINILSYLQGFSPPVLHRDIKPQNVLIGPDGRIYLVDFGSVRDTYRNTLTQGSTLVGTIGYMAPEQFRGAAAPATDLFGVGSTLLFLLTGRNPSELPHTKLQVDVRKCTRVSAPFAEWLERMLAPAIEDRFRSPAEALGALMHPTKAGRPKGKSLRFIAYGAVAVAVWGGVALLGYSTLRRNSQYSVPAFRGVADQAPETRSPVFTLSGHWSAVFGLAFTPDDKRLVSGSNDKTIKLWDVEVQRAVASFAGHTGPVGRVALLPDGTLASAGDSTVRIWSVEDSKLLRTLKGHDGRVTSVAATSDGARVVSGGFDGTVRVWSPATGAMERSMEHGRRVLEVVITPDNKRAVSVGDSGEINLWSLDDGRKVGVLKGQKGPMSSVAVASDGQTIATPSDDGEVRVWTASATQAMLVLEKQGGEAWCVAFSPDGTWLAASGQDDIVRIYHVFSGRLTTHFPAGQGGVLALTYSHDGQLLATAGGSNSVRIWSVSDQAWRPPLAAAVTSADEPHAEPGSTDINALLSRADYLIDSYAGNGVKLEEATALLTHALERDPKSARAHAILGRLQYKSGYLSRNDYAPGSLEKALEHLNHAVELDPDCFDAHLYLGYAHLFQNDLGLARKSAQRALDIQADSPRAKLLLANTEETAKDWAKVQQHAKEVIDSDAPPLVKASAYGFLTSVFDRQRNWEATDVCYRSIINLNPQSAWAKGNYSGFLSRRHRYDEAIDWAQKALAQADYGMGRRALALAYYGKGMDALGKDAAAGCKLIERSLEVYPLLGEGYYGRGVCLREEGRARKNETKLAAAERAFRRAAELEPEWELPKKALAGGDGGHKSNNPSATP